MLIAPVASSSGGKRRARQHREIHIAGKGAIYNVTATAPTRAKVRRSRAVRTAFLTLVSLGLLIGAIFGSLHIYDRYFVGNPAYELKVVDVRTDGALPRESIIKAAGLQLGINLFRVNLAEISRRLEQLPQVEKVALKKIFPGTVLIEIVERRPIAWALPLGSQETREQAAGNPASLFVDAKGTLMHIRQPAPEHVALPIIRGCPSTELRPGAQLRAEAPLAALAWLSVYKDSGSMARFAAQEIDISRGYALIVTDRTGLAVTFGVEGYGVEPASYAEQLARLDTILQECERSGQRPASINLMVARNTPVILSADVTPTPGAATPVPEPDLHATPAPARGAATPAKPTPTPKKITPTPKPTPTEIPVRKALPVR
ncbi:MAG: FtsQ-type POTRA domain-containing protein [Verrucomicrobia bacterium]|nr:FtsQ-type POTRA domain-containing protein [Verrucomicrobiota bacterium]